MDNMPYLSLVVFALVCLFSQKYRRSAFILLAAFIVNIILLPLYTRMVETDNPDVSFICGGVDVLTAFFMLKYGNKDRVYQGFILIGAVMMNAASLLSFGIIPITDFVYIILAMNIAQILFMTGGIYRNRMDTPQTTPADSVGFRIGRSSSVYDMEDA